MGGKRPERGTPGDTYKPAFFFVNACVIRGEKTVLFDTGGVLEPEDLPGFLKENGVDPGETGLIVIRRAHRDHFQPVKAWKDLSGAKVLCHKNGVDFISTGNRDNPFDFGPKAQAYPPFMEFMMTTRAADIPPVTPDIVVGDEDCDLHPPGIPGKIIYTPGHADSAIALVMDNRVVFTGDTVVDLHTIQCRGEKYPEGTNRLNRICSDEEVLKHSIRRLPEEGGYLPRRTRCAVQPHGSDGTLISRAELQGSHLSA